MARIHSIFGIFRPLSILPVAMAVTASLCPGQTSTVPLPPQTIEEALHQMSDKASVIFVGQVTQVRQQSGDGIASGVVEIQFRVDQAIRGCTSGTPYILREWAGLWSGGFVRYRVGQTLLMFLRAPGASGLSSPVNGLDGAIPIHGATSPFVVTGSTSQQYSMADLRWISAKLLRTVSYRPQAVHFNHRTASSTSSLAQQPIAQAKSESVHRADLSALTSSPATTDSVASKHTEQTPVQSLVEMLQSWQRVPDAGR